MRSPKSSTHLIQLVSPFIEQEDIESIMDQRPQGQFSAASAWRLVEAAMPCLAMTANERLNMNPRAVGAEGMIDSF